MSKFSLSPICVVCSLIVTHDNHDHFDKNVITAVAAHAPKLSRIANKLNCAWNKEFIFCFAVAIRGKHFQQKTHRKRKTYIRVMPQLEEMSSYIRQVAWGMLPHHLNVLICHLPNWGATSFKECWVMEVTL